jgi:hypothetical protein
VNGSCKNSKFLVAEVNWLPKNETDKKMTDAEALNFVLKSLRSEENIQLSIKHIFRQKSTTAFYQFNNSLLNIYIFCTSGFI